MTGSAAARAAPRRFRSSRAVIVTLLGLVLSIGSVAYVVQGLAHRHDSAQSAITVKDGDVPEDVEEYVIFSAGGSELDATDTGFVDSMAARIRDILLRQAEAAGSFSAEPVTVWVSDNKLLAVSNEVPIFRGYWNPLVNGRWTPHAYMIPVFAGGLITFAGLFWLAARWHVAASIRRREIDETPL
ncbi:hypothetical protein [Paramicrobacterium agarici]|uniref:Uncharacterized protein n=1 Tax=Paramicrobacterium agarici TaxID=630514 RepID=A0A2A9DTQ2_9MICO|nr:hypothetical protein [Microbacterium agarici]PFG29300.1 hypothetical protein ATJ78_0203 [Microbacterium agarici]